MTHSREEISPYPGRTHIDLYGDFGGPIFDPEELIRIKQLGHQRIALVEFSRTHGLEIIKGHEEILASLLAQDDQEARFSEDPDGAITFRASDVGHVADAFQRSGIEELTPHIVGGRELLSRIAQGHPRAVGSVS